MLPIVWFYIALVVVSWTVLAYLEIRRRARKKINGCPELIMISAAKLDSLAVREPSLMLIELADGAPTGNPRPFMTGATPATVASLRSLLSSTSGQMLVFCAAPGSVIDWERVGDILFALKIKKAYVLDSSMHRQPEHPKLVNASS